MANRNRGSSRRFAGRSQRAPTNWSRFVEPAHAALGAASKTLVATFTLDNPGIGETVRRTRGLISMGSDQAVSIEDQVGALGMVVVNDLALAAGAASIPGPVTEAADDGWFVWVPFSQRSAIGAPTAGGNINTVTWEFDSKAMRRIEEGFSVAVMVENANPVTGIFFAVSMSMLTSLS